MSAPDSTQGGTKNYREQGGSIDVIGGQLDFDTTDAGQLTIDDAVTPLKCTITAAAGAANVCDVTFQLADGTGNLAVPAIVDIYLSDAAAGGALTATTASGGIAAGASGTVLDAMVAAKAIRVLTDATGKFVLAITDTGKTHFYPCIQLPVGRHIVGTQLLTANYG